MFENARLIALLSVSKGPQQERSHEPQVEDFDLSSTDAVFVFDAEDMVKIPFEEFPEEVQEAAQAHQKGVQEAVRKARIERDSFASLSVTASPVFFPEIKTISVHVVSPEGEEGPTSKYRLFISFLVGWDSYRTPHDAGTNYHYLLAEVVVDVPVALKLVQHLMYVRVLAHLKIDERGVSRRRSMLEQENGCDYSALRLKRAELLREHGLDDESIKRRRAELLREHSLTDEQNQTAMGVIYDCHGLDDEHVAGQRERVRELLVERFINVTSGPDQVKTLIEVAATIREEDTKPQG